MPNISLCLPLSASLSNLGRGLPRAAAQITYDTKLTLPEANTQQAMSINWILKQVILSAIMFSNSISFVFNNGINGKSIEVG